MFSTIILSKKLKKSEYYVIGYDESIIEQAQNCQMDILIRYFNKDGKQVKIFGFTFSWAFNSVGLFEQFTNAVNELNPNCILQISKNSPSVNLKLLQKVQDHMEANKQPQLVDINSCELHTIHGGFKAGVQSTDWMLKEVLNSAYHILRHSPALRNDCQAVTGSSVFPLNFCSTQSF